MSSLPFVVLASSSPRRQQLVRQMGAEFTVVIPEAEEIQLPGESPEAMVERLALAKAAIVAESVEVRALLGERGGVVLGSDTTVVLNGAVLGKPSDADEARSMLGRLSGHTHTVFTGFALIDPADDTRIDVGHERTDVTFRELSREEIDWYVGTGSPLDKAGAYGIQDDFGAVFIERINGDYYTVVGLPLARVYVALQKMRR